jgi:hypothetical protein
LPRINYLRKENVKITGGYWGIVKLVRRLPLAVAVPIVARVVFPKDDAHRPRRVA